MRIDKGALALALAATVGAALSGCQREASPPPPTSAAAPLLPGGQSGGPLRPGAAEENAAPPAHRFRPYRGWVDPALRRGLTEA